ncbi:hypothetical protein OB08_01110 [Microbacterium sp. HJ5]
MDDVTDDELRALRAADPAGEAAAPQELRNRVASLVVSEADIAQARSRWGSRWLAPMAAGTSILLALGAGYAWGTGAIGRSPAPSPLAVATGTPEDPAAPVGLGRGADGELQSGMTTGGESAVTPGIEPLVFPVGGMRPDGQRFIVPAFDEAPGRANVYAVDAGARFSAEDSARMAAALGVGGDVRALQPEAGGGWVVGSSPGASFTLSPWMGDASYSSGIPHPVTSCEERATALHGRDKVDGDGTWAFGQEMIRCMADTPLPGDELVRESTAAFLNAIGLTEESAKITTTTDASARTVMVTAARVVEGNVTEITAHIEVSSEGILSASGPTGEVLSLGDYSIVSPAEAAGRLNDPAYAPHLLAWPDTRPRSTDAAEPPAPPEAPDAGSAVPWSIMEHDIVSARLGLALLTGEDGQQYLAPAYEFTATDETVWSVLALDEDELDTTAAPPGASVLE